MYLHMYICTFACMYVGRLYYICIMFCAYLCSRSTSFLSSFKLVYLSLCLSITQTVWYREWERLKRFSLFFVNMLTKHFMSMPFMIVFAITQRNICMFLPSKHLRKMHFSLSYKIVTFPIVQIDVFYWLLTANNNKIS